MRLFSGIQRSFTAKQEGPSTAASVDDSKLHVFAWGDSSVGQCLRGVQECVAEPILVELRPDRHDFKQLGACWEQSFLVASSGSLWAGGSNRAGCLSSSDSSEVLKIRPMDREDLDDVRLAAISAGRDHFVAIQQGGSALATWSCSNEFGQTGQGEGRVGLTPSPLQLFAVQPGVRVHSVACGQDHSLALTERGEVFVWGDNSFGQCGQSPKSSTTSIHTPMRAQAGGLRGTPVRQVAAGTHHSMALGLSGQVLTWGANKCGQLGLGADFEEDANVHLPTVVPDLPTLARGIAGGGRHSAVILRKGLVRMAGDNRCGQLARSPLAIQVSSSFEELEMAGSRLQVRTAALGDAHTLLLTYQGELYSFGSNDSGQLGHGSRGSPCHMPRQVPMQDKDYIIWAVDAGQWHSVVLASQPPATHSRRALQDGEIKSQQLAPTTPPRSKSQVCGIASKSGNESEDESPLQRTMAVSGKERAPPEPENTEEEKMSFERLRSIGCTSVLSQTASLVVPITPKKSGSAPSTPSDTLVLLRPVVRPGTVSTVTFITLSVQELQSMVQEYPGNAHKRASVGAQTLSDELRVTVAAVLKNPTVLGCCFLFPLTSEARLNAGCLCRELMELRRKSADNLSLDHHWTAAVLQGVRALAPGGGLLRNMRWKDQVRALVLWIMIPNWPALLENYINQDSSGRVRPPEAFYTVVELVSTIARLPVQGRVAFCDVVAEDCGEITVLRDVLLTAARAFANAALKQCMQKESFEKPLWEAVLLLQLIWMADKKKVQITTDAARVARKSDPPPTKTMELLGRTLSLGKSSHSEVPARQAIFKDESSTATARIDPKNFQIDGLVKMDFPAVSEFRLFHTYAGLKVIDPAELSTDLKWEFQKNGELPKNFQSFMANGNLVPTPFKQQVLQVENQMRQQEEQKRQIGQQIGRINPFSFFLGQNTEIQEQAVFFVLQVRRDRLLHDTSVALACANPEDLRKPLKVRFADEEGVDEGGVQREFFRLLSDSMFSPDYGMFKADPESHYIWFNPATFNDPKDFELVGTLFGLSVYNNIPGFDVNLPPVLFKKLKDQPVTMDDLRIAFPSQTLSLQAVLEWTPPGNLLPHEADELFQNTFCLDFSTSYEALGQTHTVNLLTGEVYQGMSGSNVEPVSLKRRSEFVEAFKDWYLTVGIATQFNAFKHGYSRVCNSPVYNCLSSEELEAIVSGERDLDFQALKKGSSVPPSAVQFTSAYLNDFWDVLFSFDAVQKRQFLKFVTGSDIAPVGGLERLKFMVQRNGGEPTDKLPTAQTCFNLLLLPEYAVKEKMQRLLTLAIENAEGFGLQ